MHVAIAIDGNSVWATEHRLPRARGHVEGARALRATVGTAARAGVKTLTLYAFLNGGRDPAEADALKGVFRRYLMADARCSAEERVRFHVVGQRDGLSESLSRAIEHSERFSIAESPMQLRVVFDYSAHDRLVRAAWRSDKTSVTPETLFGRLEEIDHSTLAAGAVDLLIRTGSNKHLSDFMLWELAYAELFLTDCLWPDFDEQRFLSALDQYASRQSPFSQVTFSNH